MFSFQYFPRSRGAPIIKDRRPQPNNPAHLRVPKIPYVSLTRFAWSSMTVTSAALASYDGQARLCHSQKGTASRSSRRTLPQRGYSIAAMNHQIHSFLFGARLLDIDCSSSTGLRLPLTNGRPPLAVEIGVRSR